jgi:hypothetical protein
MNPSFLSILDKEKVCPDADARLLRTAMVLKGWTTIHPRHPPRPDVVKMTDFGTGCLATGAREDASDEVAIIMNDVLADAGADGGDSDGRLCAL